jgi:erythronate-4-phosphate dehydrogenase
LGPQEAIPGRLKRREDFSEMKAVIDKDIPFIKGVLEKSAEVLYLPGASISQKDVMDADALIVRTRTTCDDRLLGGTKVRFIASATIGYDHIDTEFCRANNIQWTNAQGCNSSSVQQYVAAALFHLSNKLELPLAGKTIGIVGVGNVGSKVANLCAILGMKVLLNDPPRERVEGSTQFVSLKRIVEEADIITFHVPLYRETEDRTFHLVDEKFLATMKPSQILLNTSRGEVVDTSALRALLARHKIAACVLDVWEDEPGINLELLNLVDVATPHIAGYSADGKANGTSMAVRAFSRFFKLGIDDWFPEHIPTPANATIELDCANLKRQKIACKLVSKTYDVLADDQRLRNSPHTFEQQRSSYPLRREFPAFTAKLVNAGDDIRSMVKQIGFNVIA